jgi:hypothetical protein
LIDLFKVVIDYEFMIELHVDLGFGGFDLLGSGVY